MPEQQSPFGADFDRGNAADLAATLKVLANKHRLRIVHLLHHRAEMSVKQLTEQLDMSQPSVSHHLQVLRSARVVRAENVGAEVRSRLNRDAFTTLAGLLSPGGDRS